MISGSGSSQTGLDANLSIEQLQDQIKQLLTSETSPVKLNGLIRYLKHGIPPNISSQDRNAIIDNLENTRTVLHHLGKISVDALWGTLLLGLPFMYTGQGFWMFIHILGIDSGINLHHYDDKNNFSAVKGALIGCAIYSTAFQTLRAITASPRCTWISNSMTRKEAIHVWIAVVFGVAFFTGMFSGVDTTTEAVYLAGVASTLIVNELLCFFGFAYNTGEWPWEPTQRGQMIDGVEYDNWALPYEGPRIIYPSFSDQPLLYSQPTYTRKINSYETTSQQNQQHEGPRSIPTTTEPQQTPSYTYRTPDNEILSNISSTTSYRAASKAPSGFQRLLKRTGLSSTPPPNSGSNQSTLERVQVNTLNLLVKWSPTPSASKLFTDRIESLPSSLRKRGYRAADANTIDRVERGESRQTYLTENPMAHHASQSAPTSPTQRYVTLEELDQLSPSDRSKVAQSMRLWLQSNPDQQEDNPREEKVDQQSTNQPSSVVFGFAKGIIKPK